MTTLEELAARELSILLTDAGTQSSHRDNQVVFERWPTLRIKLVKVKLVSEIQQSKALQADIQTQLNVDHPDSYLMSCCTGIGNDLTQAIQNGMDAWMHVEAPLVLSLLSSQPTKGAEWFPNGDPSGVQGWDVFSSPYMLRGMSTGADILQSFLQEHPLLDAIRQDLTQVLDRHRILHTISLYRGVSGGQHFADCRINGQEANPLHERLLTCHWPSEGIAWASVRQSLLLMQPSQ